VPVRAVGRRPVLGDGREVGEDGVADPGERLLLGGGQRVEEVAAHVLPVAGGGVLEGGPASGRQDDEHAALVVGAGPAFNQAALGHPGQVL